MNKSFVAYFIKYIFIYKSILYIYIHNYKFACAVVADISPIIPWKSHLSIHNTSAWWGSWCLTLQIGLLPSPGTVCFASMIADNYKTLNAQFYPPGSDASGKHTLHSSTSALFPYADHFTLQECHKFCSFQFQVLLTKALLLKNSTSRITWWSHNC